MGRTIWWYSTSLLMLRQCNMPFLSVIQLNYRRYFLAVLDFTLVMTDVLTFSPAVTCSYTSLSIGSFCCSSFISLDVTFPKMETAFNMLTISSLSLSSTIDCTTQLMYCAFCLRSSGILELLRHWSMASQTSKILPLPHCYQSHSWNHRRG